MKKMMIFAAIMVATLSANAQNEVGQVTLKPTVGMNIASMTKADNSKVRPGIVAGIEAEFGVAENFGITAGVLYSQQGVKGKDEVKVDISDLGLGVGILDLQGKLTYKLDYINIPLPTSSTTSTSPSWLSSILLRVLLSRQVSSLDSALPRR